MVGQRGGLRATGRPPRVGLPLQTGPLEGGWGSYVYPCKDGERCCHDGVCGGRAGVTGCKIRGAIEDRCPLRLPYMVLPAP